MPGTEIIRAARQSAGRGFKIVKLVKSVVDQVQDGPDRTRKQLKCLETLISIAQRIARTENLQTREIEKILTRCDSHAQSLEKLLRKTHFEKNDWPGKKTWRAIRGLAKQNDILEVLEKLEAEHRLLNMHITILNSDGNTPKLVLQNVFASLESNLSMLFNASSTSPDPVECLGHLFITDPFQDRARLIATKGEVVEGACDWIVQARGYTEWHASDGGLLWISGGPGLGKTMLSIYLTNHLEHGSSHSTNDEQRHVVVYFFCDLKNDSLNSAASIVRGLMFQLLSLRGELVNYILPIYSIQGDRLFHEDSFETLWSIFLNLINGLSITTQVSCVLDGLDECKPPSLERVLSKLNRLKTTAPRFKVIVMSREYPKSLGDSLGQFDRIRLDTEAKTQLNYGLEQYISKRVAELAQNRQYPNELTNHVKETVRQKSNGTYLWANLILKDLKVVSISDVEARLNKLPGGLNAIYAKILQEVEHHHRDLVRDILRWCTLAARPLVPNELVAALGIKATPLLDQVDVLLGRLSYCGHFLSVTEKAVTLVHQSAHEFLTRLPAYFETPRWFSLSNIEREHANLASTCLTYLQNGCLEDENRPSRYEVNRPEELGYNFLPYAGIYWNRHFRLSGQEGFKVLDNNPTFFTRVSPALEMWFKWRLPDSEVDTPMVQASLSLSYIAVELHLKDLLQQVLEDRWWLMTDNVATEERDSRPPRSSSSPLHLAARKGRLDIIQILVKNNMRVDARDAFGDTPLHLAVFHGHNEVVEYLLESGADVKARGRSGVAPLDIAIKEGHPEIVKLLLAWKAGINEGEGFERGRLELAIEQDREPSILALLLEYYAMEFRSNPSMLWKIVAFSWGPTALRRASERGMIAGMRRLLDEEWGIDVNARDKRGRTPLHCAAAGNGGSVAVRLLLAHSDVDPNAVDNRGRNPVYWALGKGKASVVKLLTEEWHIPIPECSDKNSYNAIHIASWSCTEALEKVRLMVEKFGVDPQERTQRGELVQSNGQNYFSQYETPISLSIGQGNLEVVEFLMADCHVDPKLPCRGRDGATPLHVAAENFQADIVKMLIERYGVDANSLDNQRRTSLHSLFGELSVKWRSKKHMPLAKDIVRILLEAGAEITCKDASGHTAQDIFTSTGLGQPQSLQIDYHTNRIQRERMEVFDSLTEIHKSK